MNDKMDRMVRDMRKLLDSLNAAGLIPGHLADQERELREAIDVFLDDAEEGEAERTLIISRWQRNRRRKHDD